MISRRTKEKVGVAFLHTLLTIIALAIIAGYVIPHIGKIPNISWIVTDSKAAP